MCGFLFARQESIGMLFRCPLFLVAVFSFPARGFGVILAGLLDRFAQDWHFFYQIHLDLGSLWGYQTDGADKKTSEAALLQMRSDPEAESH